VFLDQDQDRDLQKRISALTRHDTPRHFVTRKDPLRTFNGHNFLARLQVILISTIPTHADSDVSIFRTNRSTVRFSRRNATFCDAHVQSCLLRFSSALSKHTSRHYLHRKKTTKCNARTKRHQQHNDRSQTAISLSKRNGSLCIISMTSTAGRSLPNRSKHD
jgi:hypothetical protein